MKALAYVLGGLFALGFWIEDCQGEHAWFPLLLALAWPITLPFVLGVAAARIGRKVGWE
jgi:hypothetical protein